MLFSSIFFVLYVLNGLKLVSTSESSIKVPEDLQIEPEGLFVVIGKPKQFDKKVAPNTRRNMAGKSPAHIQHLLNLAVAKANKEGAISAKKTRKKFPTHLPAFLLNGNASKIQSNAKNIANDTGNNFFYERNIIIEPSVAHEKVLQEQKDKVNGTQDKTNKKLKHKFLKRRLFRQLKGKKVRGFRKHKKRRPL